MSNVSEACCVSTLDVQKSSEVRNISRLGDAISVLPGHYFRPTIAEYAVLHTKPLQRLTHLRQTGLGYLVFPNAENTRFSHTIGTAYWTTRILDALRTNYFADSYDSPFRSIGNSAHLRELDCALGADLSLDILARLFALVHDVPLLPLGHTLEYQLGFFPPRGLVHRATSCIDRISAELLDYYNFLDQHSTDPTEPLSVKRHLDVVECCFGLEQLKTGADWTPSAKWITPELLLRWLPAISLVHDIVHGCLSADQIDFSIRDSQAAGIQRSFDPFVLQYLAIFDHRETSLSSQQLPSTPTLYRLGVVAHRNRPLPEVLSAVVGLVRTRYEIAERLFYNPRKTSADAMLDTAIRHVQGDSSDEAFLLTEDQLLRMGDDQFLDYLSTEERRIANGHLMEHLLAGRLYPTVFRHDLPSDVPAFVYDSSNPYRRTEIEEFLLAQVPGLLRGEIVYSCRPLTMQEKEPDIPVLRSDSPEALVALSEDARCIVDSYRRLWFMSVLLHPRRLNLIQRVRTACKQCYFEGPLSRDGR